MKRKHLFRRLFRKIRIKFKYKKTGLPLEAIKSIYRGKRQLSRKDGNFSFSQRNPNLETFIENFGTEKASLDFGTELPTAEDTAEAESEWLESRGIHVDAKQLQDMSTRQFYDTYKDLIEDWLDDVAPFDDEDRQSYISKRIYGSK